MIGEYLFNNDGLKIWVNSCYSDEVGYHWSIGYENGRPEDSFFVHTSEFRLNGVALEPWWSLMIEPDSSGYSEMTWPYATLLETHLHEITVGDFNLTIEVMEAGFNLVENQPFTVYTGTGLNYYYSYTPISGAPETIIFDNGDMTILATWYDRYNDNMIVQELVMLNSSDVGQSLDIHKLGFNDQWIDYNASFYAPAESIKFARIYYDYNQLKEMDLSSDYFNVSLDVTVTGAPAGDQDYTLYITYN